MDKGLVGNVDRRIIVLRHFGGWAMAFISAWCTKTFCSGRHGGFSMRRSRPPSVHGAYRRARRYNLGKTILVAGDNGPDLARAQVDSRTCKVMS